MEPKQPTRLFAQAILPALHAETISFEKSVRDGQLSEITKAVDRLGQLLNLLTQPQVAFSPQITRKIVALKESMSSAMKEERNILLKKLHKLKSEMAQELADSQLAKLQETDLILQLTLATFAKQYLEASIIASHIISKRLFELELDSAMKASYRQAIEFFKASLKENVAWQNLQLLQVIQNVEMEAFCAWTTKMSDDYWKNYFVTAG